MLRPKLGQTAREARLVAARALHQSRPRLEKSTKTPFQVFVDTFRQEVKKSQELQDSVKQLQDENRRLGQSTAFKNAREALERSRQAQSATSESIKRAGEAIGSAAQTTWNSSPVKITRDIAWKTADTIEKVSEPIKRTKLYRNVAEVFDDGNSINHGGFESREARRRRRERLEAKMAKPVLENENAGTSVVAHETAKADNKGPSAFDKKFEELKEAYEESDNGLVAKIRSITDKIGSFFAETEAAQVNRLFKQMDPSFTQDSFLRLLRGYILPEVLDAYVKGDSKVLKEWFSEASYNVWSQSTKEYREKNLYSAGRVLDIRGTDIMQAKILQPSEIPVFVVSCRAQETNVYKSIKDDKVEAGIEDKILLSTYVMVFTRIPEEMGNEETRGWKILEFVRGKAQEWT